MYALSSLATPLMCILAFLILGQILYRFRRTRAGWWIVSVGTLGLLVFSLRPVSNMLANSLECKYSPVAKEKLKRLDVVVVLGAGAYPTWRSRTKPELNGLSYSRWYEGLQAYKESGAGLLVFCGGGNEAEVMKAMAVDMGIAEDKIVAESQSLNTIQNAAYLAELLPAQRGKKIGLVTSAIHMLRSEKIFKRQFPEDAIIPVPVNYIYGPLYCGWQTFIPSVMALEKSTAVLHEWIGIFWYSLRY